MNRNVAIVHYNTPELTEACVLSIRKHGGEGYHVYILDNSDERPWKRRMRNLTVFDNTKGQIIDFDKELAKYPDKDASLGCSKGCFFGSDKHIMSVQKLWELIPDGFLLLDSDVLVRKNLDFMFMEDECAAGHIGRCSGPWRRERFTPYILWINVPLCIKGGARFFDPDRSWSLHKGADDERNGWDTGASFLDDIRKLKPQCHGRRIDIRQLIFHYGSGSWIKNDTSHHTLWLKQHRDLWHMDMGKQYTVLTYIFNGYEVVHEIQEKDPEAEYILVTDNPKLTSKTWKVVYDQSLSNLSPFDKCYHVRFHPFKYAKTDIVVRIDGSIQVNKSLEQIVNDFEEYDRCLMIHPHRNTMKEEYDVWVKTRNYPKEQAEKCINFMRHMGYNPKTRGLYQGCFEIQRNNPINNKINDIVYDFLRYLGGDNIERIDQTITSFVINHMFPDLKVLPVSESLVTDSPLMTWYLHHSFTPIPDKKDKIEPYLMNRRIEYGMEKQVLQP